MRYLATILAGVFLAVAGVQHAYAIEGEEDRGVSGYKKGFFLRTADNKFSLKIGGYIQSLFLAEINDNASDTDTFRIRRARLKFKGHVYSEDYGYVLEYEFGGNKLFTTYLKANLNIGEIRFGQDKVPFNPEALSSASILQFVDRSIAHRFFGIRNERDIGLSFHKTFLDKKWKFTLGVYNGEGLNELNGNNDLLYGARLAYHIGGPQKYAFF